MHYIYLHGFASGPRSAKATILADRFSQLGIPLALPDLNQDDFSHLTLTRQLRQVGDLFPPIPEPVTIIGSSFGGLTAAWLGQLYPQVERLVLLAPAFHFLKHWLPRLGIDQIKQWQATGFLPVYHYSHNQPLPLHYGFVEDASIYDETEIQRPIPTLILHSTHDDVIPITASLNFACDRPWVTFVELDSDHALTDVSEQIWQFVKDFCELD